jgi:D-3-phosphoglycerate dehydrogenase
VAELGLALFLALGRRILEADRSVRNRTWEKEKLIGWELKGKTLGVVGAGTTGRCMGRLGVSMGMHVVACVKRYTPQRVAQMQQEGIRLVHFDEVIQTADLVSVHVPLDDSTRNLFDISTLSRMKSGAFLVNLSRGGVVDESALAQNLQQRGGLGGAALDVHEREGPGVSSPLTGFPNVILTPHIGAQTEGAHRKLGKHIVDTVDAFRPGAPLGGRLDGLDQRTTDLSGDREPADE